MNHCRVKSSVLAAYLLKLLLLIYLKLSNWSFHDTYLYCTFILWYYLVALIFNWHNLWKDSGFWGCIQGSHDLQILSGQHVVSFLSGIHSSTGVAFWDWACKELCCQIEAVYKVCGRTGLWVTLACVIVGLPASCREEQSYNIQSADVKKC